MVERLRQRSAKPVLVGSTPTHASIFLPFQSIKFLPFYFSLNSKHVDYKQVASGLVIVFYCNWKNIVLRWFGLVLCGYSTKLANNGK